VVFAHVETNPRSFAGTEEATGIAKFRACGRHPVVRYLPAFAKDSTCLLPQPPQHVNHTRTLFPVKRQVAQRVGGLVEATPLCGSLLWAVRSRKQKWRKSDIPGAGWTTQNTHRFVWSSVAFHNFLPLFNDTAQLHTLHRWWTRKAETSGRGLF